MKDEDDINQSWKNLLANPHEWWDIRLKEVRVVALFIFLSLSLSLFIFIFCGSLFALQVVDIDVLIYLCNLLVG